MAREHILLSPKAGALEVAGVDPRLLLARQIRLYIETAPVFHLVAVGFVVGAAAGLLWLYAPEQRSATLSWAFAIAAMLLVRLVAWIAYSRTRPGDDAVRGWLKWFVVPHACSMAAIGVAPLLLVPSAPGHEAEALLTISLLVYVVAVGSTQKFSAYRPVVPIVLGPMVLAYVASIVWFPGIVPKVLAFGGVVAGLWSHRMAASFNRSIVQSMELSIRNENLVAALEAHGARLREQTAIAVDARRVAEHAERAKTRFLAAASHDLRQPMHAISLLVAVLHPRSSGPEREIMARLERSVEVMDGLFSAILDLSKLDSGAFRPEMTDVPLRAVLETIEQHFGPEAAAKNLALSVFASRAVVKTDAALLERALRNLVSNAIKYTREGRVLVGCRRRGERLLVAVWDTGVGIAADHLDQVFEEYFQVDNLPRDRSQGLGLGLSIVRRLARLLGSEIEVSSVAGAGSCFGFEVPLVSYRRVDTDPRAARVRPVRRARRQIHPGGRRRARRALRYRSAVARMGLPQRLGRIAGGARGHARARTSISGCAHRRLPHRRARDGSRRHCGGARLHRGKYPGAHRDRRGIRGGRCGSRRGGLSARQEAPHRRPASPASAGSARVGRREGEGRVNAFCNSGG